MLAKARIKMRRAETLQDLIREAVHGVTVSVIVGYLESLILEGDSWIAIRHPEE